MPFRKKAGGRSGLSVYIPYYCREYRSWRNQWCGDTDSIFRNIGAQEQSAVLSDAYERLSHGYIIAFLYQQVFHVSADGRGYRLSLGRMVLGNGFIADTGILICLSGLSKVFLRNDFIGEKFFHPFILFSGCFVSDARSLYGVAVRHILGRKHHEGSTLPTLMPSMTFP